MFAVMVAQRSACAVRCGAVARHSASLIPHSFSQNRESPPQIYTLYEIKHEVSPAREGVVPVPSLLPGIRRAAHSTQHATQLSAAAQKNKITPRGFDLCRGLQKPARLVSDTPAVNLRHVMARQGRAGRCGLPQGCCRAAVGC